MMQTTQMAPALLLGGFGSIWLAKGLYAGQKLLQQTMFSGIDFLLRPPPPDATPLQNRLVVLPQIRDFVPPLLLPAVAAARQGLMLQPLAGQGPTINTKEVFTLQRDGVSVGCILLTRTGTFYIEEGSLAVFKAAPWGFVNNQTTLEQYQGNNITGISDKTRDLYDAAVDKVWDGTNLFLGENGMYLQRQSCQMLLHMLLSDIHMAISNHHTMTTTDEFRRFKHVALLLVQKIINEFNTTQSSDILNSWVDQCFDAMQGTRLIQTKMISVQDWRWCCADANYFNTNAPSIQGDNKIIGIEEWNTPRFPATDSVFAVVIEPLLLPSVATKPKFETEYGKWAHVANVRYTTARLDVGV